MRIAVTGTHGSGKTTVIEDFVAAYPGYRHVEEPYLELAQQGVAFVDGATSADLEEQLEQSCALIAAAAGADVIFDRCPFDFMAYLEVVSRWEGFEWEPDGKLLGKIETAIAALDLIALVPLSSPDEIEAPIELPKLRAQADQCLKALLRRDEAELLSGGPALVEINGTRAARVTKLAAAAGLIVR